MGADTWAVVLAAGSSERMGQPKQLLKLQGRTLLECAVAAAATDSVCGVVVVLAPDTTEQRAVLDGWEGVRIVENPEPQRGNWSSLRVALETIPDSDGVVVLLGDMPEVGSQMTEHLVGEAHAQNAWATVSVYEDEAPNHPVYLSARARNAAAERNVPRRLWSLLVDDPPQPVLHVTFDRPAPLDVDTPEDYVELLRTAGGTG